MNKIGDNELDEILSTLQEIEHIEIIRIGTRAIVVLLQELILQMV